jgi:hypothetical protein
MSAYLLMALGLVSRKLAERAVYLQLILIVTPPADGRLASVGLVGLCCEHRCI